MIRTVEALNFRCLRYVRQDLDDFHVLVGPNASGKTAFFDVLCFLGQLVSKGLEAAVRDRTESGIPGLLHRPGVSETPSHAAFVVCGETGIGGGFEGR